MEGEGKGALIRQLMCRCLFKDLLGFFRYFFISFRGLLLFLYFFLCPLVIYLFLLCLFIIMLSCLL